MMSQDGLNFKKDVFEIYSLPLNFSITKTLLLRDMMAIFLQVQSKSVNSQEKIQKKNVLDNFVLLEQ